MEIQTVKDGEIIEKETIEPKTWQEVFWNAGRKD